MHFKQSLLTDIVHTYDEAEEIRIYEDRPRHVEQFRNFFQDFNRELMGPNPQTQRKTIACDVVEVVCKATTLDPVTEVAEIQRMINENNIAYKSGTAPRDVMPMQIDRRTVSFGYLVSTPDIEGLVALVPPAIRANQNIRLLANMITVVRGPTTPHILQGVGGIGKVVRFRVTALGVLQDRLWAARVEPISASEKVMAIDRPTSVILAMSSKARPQDVGNIKNWVPVSLDQTIEFETTVGEKAVLNIVQEQASHSKKRLHENDNQQDYNGPGQSQSSNKRGGGGNSGNYRGGNQSRGRGRDRRDEGGRGGRGRGGQRGGRGRGGRGGGPQSYRPSNDDYGQQRGGYTDYDAGGGRNENGGSGMYNQY